MFLCKVTGSVVATRKSEHFTAAKLLIVHPIQTDGSPRGTKDLLALDPRFDAGIGDVVLVAREGAALAQVMNDRDVPANVIVLGVVDDWSLREPDAV